MQFQAEAVPVLIQRISLGLIQLLKSATATVLVLNTSSSFSYVDSDDLTTIPSGSFSGYITEDNDDDSPENGQIAYKFTSDGKIDLTGYDGEVDGAWLGSTYSNKGWTYKLNDSAISLDSDGKYSNGTVSLSVNPVIVKGARKPQKGTTSTLRFSI